MSKTIVKYFSIKEETIQKTFVNAFKETKNVGWLIELLLCYNDNVKLLESFGLNIDNIKSFTGIKRNKNKFASIELKRVKNHVTSG